MKTFEEKEKERTKKFTELSEIINKSNMHNQYQNENLQFSLYA